MDAQKGKYIRFLMEINSLLSRFTRDITVGIKNNVRDYGMILLTCKFKIRQGTL